MHKRILLLVPGAYTSSGGIQAYSRELIDVLARHPDVSLQVVSKNDLPGDMPGDLSATCYGTGGYSGLLRTLSFCGTAVRCAFAQNPDVVISLLTSFSPLQLLLRKFSGAQTVLVGYGIDVWQLTSRLQKYMWKIVDNGVTISTYTQERLVQQGVLDMKRSSIIMPCFDEERYKVQEVPQSVFENYGIQTDRNVILSVGRVSSGEGYKGCDQILSVLKNLKEREPSVYYLHAGSGDDIERLRNRVQEEGLADCAQFVGFVPEELLSQLFNACSIFCMPSTGEGFGIVFVEALSCGKPVIIANSGGSLDLLQHDLPVTAVSPEDQDGLIDAIQRSLEKARVVDANQVSAITRERFGRRRFEKAWCHLLSLNEDSI